ncbi:MAG TPA: lipid-binding SYLF domain-containing protein [Thermodesulfobacteriota bacterium]|nr:lipid-binding SYLF domain-containing protein [Thermodesulfobacteriota bacterium]
MSRKEWLVGSAGFVFTAIFLAMVIASLFSAPSFAADHRTDAVQLVEKSKMTLESFLSDGNMGAFNDLIRQAKGVFIAPQVLKGAFIFGASGGSGVFVTWSEKTERWGGPAFYTIGGASFGLQIGGQAAEVGILAMTDRGVKALLSSSVKLGADVGIAAGPIGVGASAATANLSADILSFSRAKGLYGGISLDGAVVAVRGVWNEAYYGKKVDPIDILIVQDAMSPQAASLIQVIEKASGRK